MKYFYGYWQKISHLFQLFSPFLLSQKKNFHIKINHLQLNQAFLLFWSIFTEIDQKNLF